MIRYIFNWMLLLLISFNLSALGNQQSGINTGDSLLLSKIISDVIKNYPTIKEAEEAINASEAKIELAKSTYYPNVNLNASYTRLGPVSAIDIPHLGNFELYPPNNYNASLNVYENIFDFGKTSKNIKYENENKNLTKQTLEQVKQKLALYTTNTFYNITYLEDAIKIKDEQLQNLNQHLEYIQKKKETGSATQYEILSTKVRISNVESQKVDIQSALKVQMTALNTLLGQPENTVLLLKKENYQPSDISTKPEDSLITYAISHRDEMKIAQEKTTLAELHYKIVKIQNYPNLNLFGSGGWKNGYFPNLNQPTANFAAGIEFKMPLFDAFRTKNNLTLAKSSINTSNYVQDQIKRNIINEVSENNSNLSAAKKKIEQYTLQLKQAQDALKLAEISFKDGAITNLDLLDATTAVSESRLSVLKSQIDYIISLNKLKMAIGERLY